MQRLHWLPEQPCAIPVTQSNFCGWRTCSLGLHLTETHTSGVAYCSALLAATNYTNSSDKTGRSAEKGTPCHPWGSPHHPCHLSTKVLTKGVKSLLKSSNLVAQHAGTYNKLTEASDVYDRGRVPSSV